MFTASTLPWYMEEEEALKMAKAFAIAESNLLLLKNLFTL